MDISKYVDRALNNYIVYHPKNFINRGDMDRAYMAFEAMHQEANSRLREDLAESQLQAQVDGIAARGEEIAAGVDVVGAMQSGALLEETMERIAASLNESIEKYANSADVDDLLDQAKVFRSNFTTGNMDTAAVNGFFNLIHEGLRRAGPYTMGLVAQLTQMGRMLSNDTSFTLDGRWEEGAITAVSKQDLQLANQVSESLWNAVNKFKSAGGTISRQAFTSLIYRIFKEDIGDQLARQMVSNGVREGVSHLEQALSKMPGATVKSTTPKPQATMNQATVLNNAGMELQIHQNGQTYTIEILSKGDTRLQGMLRNTALNVSANSTFGEQFSKHKDSKYLAYNVVTHRYDGGFDGVYQKLRGAVAANFFVDWVSNIDFEGEKIQFILVDNKVYSLQHIVKNICNELANSSGWANSSAMPFNIHGSTPDNSWYGPDMSPNIEFAMMRSKAINKVIDTFTIAATLNYNILRKYAY